MPLIEFHDFFATCLQTRGFTSESFAHGINKSQSYVSLLKSGKRKPPIEHLEMYADILGLRNSERGTFSILGELTHSTPKIQKTYLRMYWQLYPHKPL